MIKIIKCIGLLAVTINLFAIPTDRHTILFEGTYIPPQVIKENMVGTNPDTYTPKYVQIKGFEKCLGTKSMGSWKSWCLPKNKPSQCANSAWQELKNTTNSKC